MGGGAGPQDRGQRERGRSDSVSRASARGNKSAVSNYQQVQSALLQYCANIFGSHVS